MWVGVYFIFYWITTNEAARILSVFPTPCISHQIVFRPLIKELVKRGHEVVVITPHPAFPKGQTPSNLIEIDVLNASYESWQQYVKFNTGRKSDLIMQIITGCAAYLSIFEKQMQSEEVQKIFNDENQKFDLLLIEEIVRPAVAISHKYKVPMILISSFGSIFGHYADLGAPVHPLLYPTMFNQRIYNLTLWEKIAELYSYYRLNYIFLMHEEIENELVRKLFGTDTPSISELKKNVDMLFLNIHPVWDNNRPVPPNVIYLGGVYDTPSQDMADDLKRFLNASNDGVIYVSFGTNVKTSQLPKKLTEIMAKVFSKMPYHIIWKRDSEEFQDMPKNVKIMAWVPQADLLRHPNLRLFITQGGQQSTDESIAAGVPLIGIPMSIDQWSNTEKYAHHKIGLQLNLETITEEKFRTAIKTVIEDKSYRDNVVKLRNIMADQPQKPLERAMWWIEHVLRHGGARHLRSPAANISWTDTLELKLVVTVLVVIAVTIYFVKYVAFLIYSIVVRKLLKNDKIKKD